jgi:4-amino-4-deoxy-L-arabinose transferase
VKRALPFVALLAVLAASFAVRSRNLGALSLTEWDESYHALVARNVLRHPLTPTLIDDPAFDPARLPLSWKGSNVWFHKGPLPSWLGAAGMAISGPVPLGLRGASLALSLGSVILLCLLGRALFSPRAGLIAAALLAVNPFFTGQIHGLMLTDIVDTTLLFFVLAGLLALALAARSGGALLAAAAGAAGGLAFLAKFYLGLAVPAVAVLLVVADREARANLLRARPAAAFVGGLLGVLGPWAAYYQARFPVEFSRDVLYYLGHLTGSSEGWGAPWDRYVFDYLPNAARDAFVPGLFAGVALCAQPRPRRRGAVFTCLWLLAAAVPHVLARTKVPSYGVVAAPALLLLTAALLDDALRCEGRSLAIAGGAFAAALLVPPDLPGILAFGRGPGPDLGLFAVALTKPWIWLQAGVLAAVAAAVALALRSVRAPLAQARVAQGVRALCVAGLCVVLWREAGQSRELTLRHPPAGGLLDVAKFAESTDARSVFFLGPGTLQHASFMFYAGRTAYPAGRLEAKALLPSIEAGRPVYLLERGTLAAALLTSEGASLSRLR